MNYFVYILASKPYGTLYIGITNDLVRRVYEHKMGFIPSFTKRYKVILLVYFEIHQQITYAIQREKTLKHWKRDWKIDLIKENNPQWTDLWDTICQ